LLASKISFIVEDDSVRNPEATNYVFLEDLDNLLPAGLGEQYCLDPFGKIIGGYK